jgi:hypothetical protein
VRVDFGSGLDCLLVCMATTETSHHGWFGSTGYRCSVAATSECHFDSLFVCILGESGFELK